MVVEEEEDLNIIGTCNVDIGYEKLTGIPWDRIKTKLDCDKNASRFWLWQREN